MLPYNCIRLGTFFAFLFDIHSETEYFSASQKLKCIKIPNKRFSSEFQQRFETHQNGRWNTCASSPNAAKTGHHFVFGFNEIVVGQSEFDGSEKCVDADSTSTAAADGEAERLVSIWLVKCIRTQFRKRIPRAIMG